MICQSGAVVGLVLLLFVRRIFSRLQNPTEITDARSRLGCIRFVYCVNLAGLRWLLCRLSLDLSDEATHFRGATALVVWEFVAGCCANLHVECFLTFGVRAQRCCR